MKLILRIIQIGMVMAVALFFSLVAFNNWLDGDANKIFIQHVLSMDTTFHQKYEITRAINNAQLQYGAFLLIVGWEFLTAITCWIGVGILIKKINSADVLFNQAKVVAFIGLFMGFLLYMVGFLDIAGEWFCMWQSSQWNVQQKCALFVNIIMLVMVFLKYDA